MSAQSDGVFTGSIPELYERYLVPILFESYAQDLVRRVRERGAGFLLEVAAGTGAVTRALADGTGSDVAITATDLASPWSTGLDRWGPSGRSSGDRPTP